MENAPENDVAVRLVCLSICVYISGETERKREREREIDIYIYMYIYCSPW